MTFNISLMQTIQQVTGHIPAILGCDYAAGWAEGTPEQIIDYSCNPYLKDHSNNKGLVTIDTHFPNPVFPNGGGLKNKSSLVFTDLLKPETETGKRWRAYLDVVAAGLNDLQQADVTVLYRPFHEMNGGWFWWGAQVSAGEIPSRAFPFLLSRIQRNTKMSGHRCSITSLIRKTCIIFSGCTRLIKDHLTTLCSTREMSILISSPWMCMSMIR